MKLLFLIVSCAIFGSAGAQKPEKIYGWARIQMPLDWYKQQSAAWKKTIDANPADANAWYNYYYANRILGFHDTSVKNKTAFMKKLAEDMEKAVPESYEFHVVKCLMNYGDKDYELHLQKALELGEGRPEHHDLMINKGELTRNMALRDQYSLQKYESGNISSGMMYYNYNVLAGLDNNAIVLTTGDNDTYPAWVLQAQGIRRDVTVLNLSLLQMDDYRHKVFQELGIPRYEMNYGSTPDSAQACINKFQTEIIKHIASNKKNNPVYMALTAVGCGEYNTGIEGDLYLTGLAYRYNTEPVDNIALLQRNFEKVYQLDYLENAFYQDISEALVKRINGNYVVPMLKLFDHYQAAGEIQKEEDMRRKLLLISRGTDDEAEVKKHVEKKN